MTIWTDTTYGAAFSEQEHGQGIMRYLNGGGYSEDQEQRLANALMCEFVEIVNDALPDRVTWQPRTSTFLHPVDVSVPDEESMAELFTRAWVAIDRRFEEIEAVTLEVGRGGDR